MTACPPLHPGGNTPRGSGGAKPPAAGLKRRSWQSGDTGSEAVWSPCETFRYLLTRRWAPGPLLLFVLLNPSTATEARNDPTVARCQARARAMDAAGFAVTNLFAFRSTDPRALDRTPDPVGPCNDAILRAAAAGAGMILCGWGNHGRLRDRTAAVTALLRGTGRPLHHLGLTRCGQPRHPLYLPAARAPEPWT